MPRQRVRVRLESGLKLNINTLVQRGIIRAGAATGPVSIFWMNRHSEQALARGTVATDTTVREGPRGRCRISVGGREQEVQLIGSPRHFGGVQWYFVCPHLHQRASVLWMPPGAREFGCRQRWVPQIAYASQFETAYDRAFRGQAKINWRLCSIGGFDPAEWQLAPKPKGMRWTTYRRAEQHFARYEAILDRITLDRLAARLCSRA